MKHLIQHVEHFRDSNRLEKMSLLVLLLFYQSNFKHPQMRGPLAICLASLHLFLASSGGASLGQGETLANETAIVWGVGMG